jgi:hypothetical protein
LGLRPGPAAHPAAALENWRGKCWITAMKNTTSTIGYRPAAEAKVSRKTAAIVCAGAVALACVLLAFVR